MIGALGGYAVRDLPAIRVFTLANIHRLGGDDDSDAHSESGVSVV